MATASIRTSRACTAAMTVSAADSRLYGLAEWVRTNEHANGAISTSLSGWLGEAAWCKRDIMAGARLEVADRPEEEPLADPFRTPRPPSDLSNLGVSRWTTLTVALSAPRWLLKSFSARPFVEVGSHSRWSGRSAGPVRCRSPLWVQLDVDVLRWSPVPHRVDPRSHGALRRRCRSRDGNQNALARVS